MADTSQGTGAWIGFDLSDEQRQLLRERTGQDAGALFLTLTELASGRFFARPETPPPAAEAQS